MTDAVRDQTVFVTGATGYVGGRLVPRLLDAGYPVRCLARDPGKLESRPWAAREDLETVGGDASDEEALTTLLTGCDVAYYLIHSMLAAGPAYRSRDHELASTFARAASRAEVKRIIYLGGLGETGKDLSEHLDSRREVERALRSTGVPVTVLRAAMIIGAGSASFEILRYLVERLPLMVTPRWVATESQPIAIRNVLHYLVASLEVPATVDQILDIGGPDILSYREILDLVAEALKLRKRWVLPVPVLTPRLSSLWIHLVTPVSHRVARPLAEGLKNRVVCRDQRAHELMPQDLLSVKDAIEAAVLAEDAAHVESSWLDAGVIPGDPDWAGGKVFVDQRHTIVDAAPSAVFRAISRIGGRNGWYAADFLWQLRGVLDRLIGGPGLRRFRKDPERIAYGDALDFWRVTRIEPDRRLELQAEMKIPGTAQLGFEIRPEPAGGSRLTQTARFKPRGLLGLLYWYGVSPFHGLVFRGMLRGIRRASERLGQKAPQAPPETGNS